MIVFHQHWNFITDEVTPGLHFNITPKQRGINKGNNLTQMSREEIQNVKLTKTILARLLGQIYDLSGLLSPIRGSLLSLFSKACQVLKDWTSSLPPDHELSVQLIQILLELNQDIPSIRPFPRCKLPEGSTLQRIVVFSDASLDIVAFSVYLDVREADFSCSSRFLFGNCYSRHAPSLL